MIFFHFEVQVFIFCEISKWQALVCNQAGEKTDDRKVILKKHLEILLFYIILENFRKNLSSHFWDILPTKEGGNNNLKEEKTHYSNYKIFRWKRKSLIKT